MVFDKPYDKLNFHTCLDGWPIIRADKTRNIGVWIDSRLSWRDHITTISVCVARRVGILSELKHILPRNILRCTYCSIILPYLNACLYGLVQATPL